MSAPRIRRLPDPLVNKIAAGEVIERPASAVKELVENALDAAARGLTIDLADGGSALVRVIDDGTGILAEDLPLALERHATSKLVGDDTLDAIVTLGFRGEALAAICAVSRFSVTSRARDAAEGLRLDGEGGVVRRRFALPAERGTSVEIRDLFFNTPARLKFLKSAPTELAATLRAITQLALAQPGVRFRVTHNGRPALTAPVAPDLRERVAALWTREVAARLLAVDRTEHGLQVTGLVSPPTLSRGSRDDIVLVVNGRPVRDPALLQAVLEAYRPLLPRDRFPMAVLTLALPPGDVDVNVHPTKAWVRFRHPRLVHEMLATAVRDALRRPAVVPDVAAGALPGAEAAREAPAPATGVAEQAALFVTGGLAATPKFGRVLGQVQDTFIVTASEAEVFFVDQHVAHERVIFERLSSDLAAGPAPSQALLFPEALELGPAQRALLERWREPLEGLGFAFEDGPGGLVLRSVPTLLKQDEPTRLVEAALADLGGLRAGEPTIARALAFVACRAAVKAGAPLEREEMERLVDELAATVTPYFCPHGRPIMSRVSLADIRRELRRHW